MNLAGTRDIFSHSRTVPGNPGQLVTLVWRALTKADTLCTKELPGLIRTDGKRLDGATLVPWAEANTSPGTSQPSTRVRPPTSTCRHLYQEGLQNMPRTGNATNMPLSRVLMSSSWCRCVRRAKRVCFLVSKDFSMHPALQCRRL